MLVIVHVDPTSGIQPVNVHLPAGITGLTPAARGLLVLDVVHATMTRLAQARGWDTDVLDVARTQCLDQNVDFRWSSPWKTNPGRTLQARAVYRFEDDGYGRVRLEIATRDAASTSSRRGSSARRRLPAGPTIPRPWHDRTSTTWWPPSAPGCAYRTRPASTARNDRPVPRATRTTYAVTTGCPAQGL